MVDAKIKHCDLLKLISSGTAAEYFQPEFILSIFVEDLKRKEVKK